MKYILSFLATLALVLFAGSSAYAANSKVPVSNSNNPQIVAYYPDGPHGIVGEPEYHSGADLVKQNGNSGNFQQWFYGTSESEGLHGEHSVWKVSKDGSCPEGWILVPKANPDWGDYLVEGADYCVKTNDFRPSK